MDLSRPFCVSRFRNGENFYSQVGATLHLRSDNYLLGHQTAILLQENFSTKKHWNSRLLH